MERHRYVAVEGPIGAGKTSLARRLAARMRAELLLEQPGENPFLARFYQDMARYALPTQLFFLFQRARQLEPLAQRDLFNRATVADFLIDKDPLFASLTLSGDELALYQRVYESLRPQAPAPDLVIYLQAPAETLIERVRRRAAPFERGALFLPLRRSAGADRQFAEPQLRRPRRGLRAARRARAQHALEARVLQRGVTRRRVAPLGAPGDANPR